MTVSDAVHESFELILPFFPVSVQILILDSGVTDLMLNANGSVFTERNGQMVREEGVIVTREKMQAAAENILSLLGGYITTEDPIQDSRLPDGARVAVVGPPCSPDGYTITIRKFNHWFTLEELVEKGAVPEQVADDLLTRMMRKKNILVSGRNELREDHATERIRLKDPRDRAPDRDREAV